MHDLEETIRRRAYDLWERAGCPQGRSDEFWHAARAEIEGEGPKVDAPFDPFEPPVGEPPEVAFQRGVPVGMPGERIAEQGVLDDRLVTMIPIPHATPDD